MRDAAESTADRERRNVQRLRHDVRRAINFFPAGGNWREGVEPRELKQPIRWDSVAWT